MFNALQQGLVFLHHQALLIFICGIFFCALSLPTFLNNHPKKSQENLHAVSVLLLFLALSLILRLAFISKLSLPLYFDSAEHWRIITAIQNGSPLKTIIPRYYHIGYHFLIAVLAKATHVDTETAMLVSGQIIITLIPLPVYSYLWHKTHEIHAALFGALLASFAWTMPAFALNWGKYPMLAGLLLGSSLLLYALGKHPNKAVLGIGALLTIFIHSRMAIFIIIATLSWILAEKIISASPNVRRIALGFGLVSLLGIGMPILDNNFLKLALEPYLLPPSGYITLAILLLSPFAYLQAPKDFFFNLALIIGLLASLFIPFRSNFLGFGKLTLLDRPFVEAVLYLPLALIGGLGVAWLIKNIHIPNPVKKNSVYSVLLGIFVLYTLYNYNYQPSPCCNFVSPDDINAITWLEKNTAPDSQILIAGEPMSVMPDIQSLNLTATDAGIWLALLTERKTLRAAYLTDFSAEETHRSLCTEGIDYIYAGNQAHSFNHSLNNTQGWYAPMLSLSKVRLYALTDCEP